MTGMLYSPIKNVELPGAVMFPYTFPRFGFLHEIRSSSEIIVKAYIPRMK
jgi:hypothetical protein